MVQTSPEAAAQVLFDNLNEEQLALVVRVLHDRRDTREFVGEVARLQAVEHFDVARPDVGPPSNPREADDSAEAVVARVERQLRAAS